VQRNNSSRYQYVGSAVRRTLHGSGQAGPNLPPTIYAPRGCAMTKQVRVVVCAAISALGLITFVSAQTPQITQNPDAPPTWIPDIKFASGREIIPYYEGWIKNPDDSYDLIFGYYNRNQEQEVAVPAGPENSVMPGGPDRGQPTYFLAKRQARMFRIRGPKGFGDKGVT